MEKKCRTRATGSTGPVHPITRVDNGDQAWFVIKFLWLGLRAQVRSCMHELETQRLTLSVKILQMSSAMDANSDNFSFSSAARAIIVLSRESFGEMSSSEKSVDVVVTLARCWCGAILDD